MHVNGAHLSGQPESAEKRRRFDGGTSLTPESIDSTHYRKEKKKQRYLKIYMHYTI